MVAASERDGLWVYPGTRCQDAAARSPRPIKRPMITSMPLWALPRRPRGLGGRSSRCGAMTGSSLIAVPLDGSFAVRTLSRA